MGNTQSAPQHNRLVKPKTNTNSPFLSPSVPSPASASTKYTDLHNDSVICSPTGESRSRLDARYQLRAQLTSPMDEDCSQQSDEDDGLGELANHVRDRLQSLSRSNSVSSMLPSAHASTTKLSSLSGSNLSLVSDARPVDLSAAISILHELRKNASPDDLAALREALQPGRSTESASSSVLGLSARKPVGGKPSQSLIRRRSMATPGLATRGSPTDVLRKPVKHSEAQVDQTAEHEWQMDMMGPSALARLAALDVAHDSATPRAQTPGDMAYSHLGALQLGSLMVTNGAASPAPSIRSITMNRRKSTPDFSQQEDYFTAPEGHHSPLALSQLRGNRNHFRAQSSGLPLPSPLSRESRKPGRSKKADSAPRSGSPLRREAVFNDTKRRNHLKERSKAPGQSNKKSASSMAQDYMDELASSPFATHDEFSDRYETRNSLDDGYVEVDPEDGHSYRQEAFRILDGTIFADSIDPAYGTPHQDVQKYQRPVHTKADSGYSSGASLRATESEEGTGSPLSHCASSVADEQQQSGIEQVLSLPTPEKPLPIAPSKKDVRPKPSRLSLSKSWRRSSSSATPTTISAPPTPSSVVSSESVDSKKTALQKRLQKRRPSCHTIPLVQTCEPVEEGTIPTIPDNVRAHFTRRISESPGMDHLTKTFASASHTNPYEDAQEFSSVCAPIRFPSPVEDEPRKKKHHHRSQSARPPTPPPHRQRRSLSIFRSEKSGAERDVHTGELLGVADFGTVAQSLGSSPYDIAVSTLRQAPVTSPTHPHQLGAALPRSKTTANMDASTASEFAKMRSRERAAPDVYTHRPRSYHDYNLEAGEATVARKLSGHGPQTDVPPLPSMDSRRVPRAAVSHDDFNHNAPRIVDVGVRPKLITRETSVSALIEKFNESPTKAESPDWGTHSLLWRQRRKSIGEGLHRQHGDSAHKHSHSHNASPQTESPVGGRMNLRPIQSTPARPEPVSSDSGMFDRYGGGLDYGYEIGFGVGGSAGTRHMRSGASRKSMHFSNEFGIDLSDVPVFLQKAR